MKEKKQFAIEMGKLGGVARAKKLSAERRREIATLASKARWDKHRKNKGE